MVPGSRNDSSVRLRLRLDALDRRPRPAWVHPLISLKGCRDGWVAVIAFDTRTFLQLCQSAKWTKHGATRTWKTCNVKTPNNSQRHNFLVTCRLLQQARKLGSIGKKFLELCPRGFESVLPRIRGKQYPPASAFNTTQRATTQEGTGNGDDLEG